MKKLSKKFQGFSLIELMIVVAIIGVLAAIAIPNFRTYQARARTSEAKMSLSGVWTAETAFQQENGTFATCLDQMGVTNDLSANRFYTFGFDTTDPAVANSFAPAGTASPCNATTAAGTTGTGISHVIATKFVASTGTSDVAVMPALGGDITAGTFTAFAAGNISTDDDDLDQWTIDNDKNLVHTVISY